MKNFIGAGYGGVDPSNPSTSLDEMLFNTTMIIQETKKQIDMMNMALKKAESTEKMLRAAIADRKELEEYKKRDVRQLNELLKLEYTNQVGHRFESSNGRIVDLGLPDYEPEKYGCYAWDPRANELKKALKIDEC